MAGPSHAAAFESVADDGLGGGLHRATGDDQARGVIASVFHFVPVVAKVAHFGGRLAITFRSSSEFATVVGKRADQARHGVGDGLAETNFLLLFTPPRQVSQGFVRIEPVTMDIATRSYEIWNSAPSTIRAICLDLGKEFVFFPRSHKADGFQSVVTPLLALSAS